jgi:hypothetical protein
MQMPHSPHSSGPDCLGLYFATHRQRAQQYFLGLNPSDAGTALPQTGHGLTSLSPQLPLSQAIAVAYTTGFFAKWSDQPAN